MIFLQHRIETNIASICREVLIVWEQQLLFKLTAASHAQVVCKVQKQTFAASNIVRLSLLSLILPLNYRKLCRAVWFPEQSSLAHKAFLLFLRPILTYIFCLSIMAAVEAESAA